MKLNYKKTQNSLPIYKKWKYVISKFVTSFPGATNFSHPCWGSKQYLRSTASRHDIKVTTLCQLITLPAYKGGMFTSELVANNGLIRKKFSPVVQAFPLPKWNFWCLFSNAMAGLEKLVEINLLNTICWERFYLITWAILTHING